MLQLVSVFINISSELVFMWDIETILPLKAFKTSCIGTRNSTPKTTSDKGILKKIDEKEKCFNIITQFYFCFYLFAVFIQIIRCLTAFYKIGLFNNRGSDK